MMGGRLIHYCGACGEELFDNMECQICTHPFVIAALTRAEKAEAILKDEREACVKRVRQIVKIFGVRGIGMRPNIDDIIEAINEGGQSGELLKRWPSEVE